MAPKNALRQFVAARRMMESCITVAEVVRELKRIKIYRNKTYQNLYKTVQRIFESVDKKTQYKTRKRSVRTPNNVKLVRKILNKTKTTRKRCVRGIKACLKEDYNVDVSISSVRRILIHDLKKKFVI